MLSAIFVDRPRLAIVIAIVTTIAGLLALFVDPDRAISRHRAAAGLRHRPRYPGAQLAVVDATVAQPIEAQVVGVDKMIYMKSVSGDDGSYTLTARSSSAPIPTSTPSTSTTASRSRCRSLPQDVQRQGVTVKKKSSALLGVIAVYSPKHTHDPLFLSNYVTINLLDQIKSTPGVGDATLWGPQDYAMRAWVRTDRLTGLNLTTGDIINAIQSQNVQAAVGRIGARPISNDQQLQLNIQTKGRLTTVEEFENIVIRTNPDGSVLRLGDVARLELGAANLDRETRFNGGPAAAIGDLPVARAPTRIATLKAVRDQLAELAKALPRGSRLEGHLRPDRPSSRDTIHEVQKTLVEAFVLVVLVVFLFLGSVRATLIPTLAVPVSLIGTFIVLQGDRLFGQHGFAARHRAGDRHRGRRRDRRGRERRAGDGGASRAVARARRPSGRWHEITAPIIAITLVLLSVFVPVAFIPGISGELFRQFAVTVAVSMFLSAINALTLSPALVRRAAAAASRAAARRRSACVMRSIDRVRDAYGAAVARLVRVLDHRPGRWSRVAALGIVGLPKIDADRLPAGGRPGRVLRRRPAARRRLGRAHRRTSSGRPRRSCARKRRSRTSPRSSA